MTDDDAIAIVRDVLRDESLDDEELVLQAIPTEDGFFVSGRMPADDAVPDFGARNIRYFVANDGNVCGVPTFVRSASHFQQLLREEGGRKRFAWRK